MRCPMSFWAPFFIFVTLINNRTHANKLKEGIPNGTPSFLML